jgi:Outer membrane protein beta-barrel domain
VNDGGKMKKLILFMIVVFVFSILNAQLDLSYVFKAGFVISNQDFDYKFGGPNLDLENSYGLVVGPSIGLFNKSNIDLIIELNYVQKGTIYEIEHFDENGNNLGTLDLKNRVEYLSLLFLGELSYNSTIKLPYLIIGPRIDILIGYKSEDNIFDAVYDDFESFDFGGSIGLGYELNFWKSNNFLFEIRFSPSFTNSYKTEFLTVKNTTFDFLTGIKF